MKKSACFHKICGQVVFLCGRTRPLLKNRVVPEKRMRSGKARKETISCTNSNIAARG